MEGRPGRGRGQEVGACRHFIKGQRERLQIQHLK